MNKHIANTRKIGAKKYQHLIVYLQRVIVHKVSIRFIVLL